MTHCTFSMTALTQHGLGVMLLDSIYVIIRFNLNTSVTIWDLLFRVTDFSTNKRKQRTQRNELRPLTTQSKVEEFIPPSTCTDYIRFHTLWTPHSIVNIMSLLRFWLHLLHVIISLHSSVNILYVEEKMKQNYDTLR
jgi:hypothetical protein